LPLPGPFANLVMALGWAMLFRFAIMSPENIYALPMAKMADAGMQINAVLMLLNLLPLPPLDGGRIAVSLLPAGPAYTFSPPRAPTAFRFCWSCCSPVSLATFSGHWWPFSVLPLQPLLDFDYSCSLNASSPACAPPGVSTSATITVY
jgi:hypothetical protein